MEFEAFCQVVRRILNRPRLELTRDMKATQVPGWDSLQHVVILMEIEADADIEIDPSETSQLSDLGALVDFITQREQGG